MSRNRSPLLDRPGAVEADGLDAGVAAHYGSDLREQGAKAYRACFAERFKTTPAFAKVTQQAQALLDRLSPTH